MSKKENNKKTKGNVKHISLSHKGDRIKAMALSIVLGCVFAASTLLSILLYQWWAFIIALASPVALYISVKFTIAVYKRGVDITGDTVTFEPEYKYFVKFNRRELSKIYVKDPNDNKEVEGEKVYKNKEIVFQLKNREKHGYPLPFFTAEDLENLKKNLLS